MKTHAENVRFKEKARSALRWAVKSGKIKKPLQCQNCGSYGRLDGHHKDHSKPFDVEWLCKACHGREFISEKGICMTQNQESNFNAAGLRTLMQAKGFSYLTLARALQAHEPKCSKQIVWKWATERSIPESRYVNALAKVFKKSPIFFFKT